MPKYIEEPDFIQAYVNNNGSATKIAEELGIRERGVRARIRRYIDSGKLNLDEDIPNFRPGAGRRITKVSKSLDRDGVVLNYAVQEQPESKTEFKKALAKPVRVSTLRGRDGEVIQQWEITKADNDNMINQVQEAAQALKEELPRIIPVARPELQFVEALTNLYVLSDAHIGGLTWKVETGHDWDLKIAEELLTKTFIQMIHQSPNSSKAVICLLGDWMHYDKLEAVTTLSNNILDSDGRRGKMIKVAIRVARHIIEHALKHHDTIDLLIAEGNHDIIGSAWLRELFVVAYENEGRVRVIEEERPFYAVKCGDTFLGFHHGHIKGVGKRGQPNSGAELVSIFADEFAPMWGQTTKRYIHSGHLHYAVEAEVRGARVMQHPTITGRDSYASRHGYGSLREARSLTYHTKFGQTGMVNISPEMIA